MSSSLSNAHTHSHWISRSPPRGFGRLQTRSCTFMHDNTMREKPEKLSDLKDGGMEWGEKISQIQEPHSCAGHGCRVGQLLGGELSFPFSSRSWPADGMFGQVWMKPLTGISGRSPTPADHQDFSRTKLVFTGLGESQESSAAWRHQNLEEAIGEQLKRKTPGFVKRVKES